MAELTDRTQPETAAHPLLIDGLPPCAIHEADGTYSITAQLTPDDAAALTVAAPSHDELCQHAQHALGLSGIGSRIERERDAIGVYAAPLRLPSGESTLMLEGREVLWAVAHASPPTIRALISAAQTAMGIRGLE
ncbi:MAG TPA: hypothetical protein VFX76_22110 [Roseiflexaceae bacterium]|nr:hypothetical protein [Roseiflexaceae bacterium]